MVLPQVLLSVLPELIVVVALDDVATDARDLLHALIVCGKDSNTNPNRCSNCKSDTPAHGRGQRCRFRVDAKAVPLRAPARLHHEPTTEIHLHRSL